MKLSEMWIGISAGTILAWFVTEFFVWQGIIKVTYMVHPIILCTVYGVLFLGYWRITKVQSSSRKANSSIGDAGIREESGKGESQLDTSPDKEARRR